MRKFPLTLALLPAVVLLPSPAPAETIFSDSFEKVAIVGSGRAETAYSEGNVYQAIGGSAVFSRAPSGPGGLALSGDPYSAIYARFPRVKLRRAGDSLTATFTVQYPLGAASANYGLRIGLYLIADDLPVAFGYDAEKNPRGDKAPGYYLATNPGRTADDATVLSKDLANQKAPSTASAVNSNVAGSASFLAAGPSSRLGNSQRVFSVSITRTETGVRVTGGPDDAEIAADDDDEPWREFDSVVISVGDGAGPFRIDDLVVSTLSSGGQ